MNESPRDIHIIGGEIGGGRSLALTLAIARAKELGMQVVEIDSAAQLDDEITLRSPSVQKLLRELTCLPEQIEDRKAHKAAMKKANKKKPARGGGRP